MRRYIFVFLDRDGQVQASAIEDCEDEKDMRDRARVLAGAFHGVEVWLGGRRLHIDLGHAMARAERAQD